MLCGIGRQGTKAQGTLKQIRDELAVALTMSYFNDSLSTEVFTDTSPVGLGASLTQLDEKGVRCPIAYASRALSDVERRYSHTEREALATIWACKHFHLYIYGKHVRIYMDHKPLVSIFGNPNSKPPTRIKRWTLKLQPYDISVVYRPGKDNPADYLSHHSTKRPENTSRAEKIAEGYVMFITDNMVPKAMTVDEVRVATQNDETLQAVVNSMHSGRWYQNTNRNIDIKAYGAYFRIRDELTIDVSGDISSAADSSRDSFIVATASRETCLQRSSRID